MAKIAMVLARSPGGPMTGRKAVIRTAIASLAAEGHEVDLIVLAKAEPGYRREANVRGEVRWLGTPGKPRVLINAAAALIGGTSLNEALFRSGALLERVRAFKGAYDFAIADTLRAAPYASALGVPWHLDMDDLFSERYARFAAAGGNVSAELVLGYYRDSAPGIAAAVPGTLMRRVLLLEASRMQRRELYWARKATTVSLVSPDEAQRFERACGRRVHSLPMSVAFSGEAWRAAGTARSAPVFVGPLDYKPNLDALDYYQRQVFPALKASGAGRVLHHVGASPDPLRRLFSEQVVRFEGYVADLAARLRDAAFFIAPIVSGTGIKTKVLEAMAAGVPVVTTPEGVSGLRVEDRRHCLVCATPGDFPSAVNALGEPGLAASLSEAARRYVEDNFSPQVLRRRWSAVLAELGA